jgi:hypothetical protein
MAAFSAGNYAHVTTAQAGTLLSPVPCVLANVTINTAATQTLTIYDGLSSGGTVVAVVTNATTVFPETLNFNVQLKVGLFIVSTGTGDLTITWG